MYKHLQTWEKLVLIFLIPTDAIERVEIFRDGASAQYGSDDCWSYEYHFKKVQTVDL
jgi:hypothetical protein